MGVIPLPSFVSRVPNVSVPIIGGLQSFVLGKFALPTLGSGVAALTKQAVEAMFFSSLYKDRLAIIKPPSHSKLE